MLSSSLTMPLPRLRPPHTLGLLLVVVLPTLAFAAPAVAQTTTLPSSLNGETLFADASVTSPNLHDAAAACNAGGDSIVNYDASGVAAGPYPGTFEETGTVKIGTQNLPNGGLSGTGDTVNIGPVVQFNATFRIVSGTTEVTGTKTTVLTGAGICSVLDGAEGTLFGFENAAGSVAYFSLTARYQATIHIATGAFRDEGRATAGLTDADLTGFKPATGQTNTRVAGFGSSFISDGEVVPLLPTSTDQCKNGGWQVFGVFKNQGDCESFVATGGKNPPANP